jgi:hypothetical protein
MNKLTKTLLILPVIALTTIGCGEAKPRIVTAPNPLHSSLPDVTVNCTDELVLNQDGVWESREDTTEGFRHIFDYGIEKSCG